MAKRKVLGADGRDHRALGCASSPTLYRKVDGWVIVFDAKFYTSEQFCPIPIAS